MDDTTTKRHSEVQMDRIKELAEINPDVYRFALAWLAGAGDVDGELGNHVDDAIEYVALTYLL